jgi:alkanesulfonate monooxygenase SsuD/methylene tetrahydromethanopterin reductase-like flavin-dependent oxidoreductase (luciferase family)
MEISMTMPTMVPHGRSDTLAWCRAIDEGPWASLAVPERVTYPSHSWTVELAAAAALTERVRLWTTIIVLPAHDAVDVAKQLASVDQLSAGRLTVGVGVGGNVEGEGVSDGRTTTVGRAGSAATFELNCAASV